MRRLGASAWARDPDSVYSRGTFYTRSTKRSSTGPSTRIANSDSGLILDEGGAAKVLGATVDADDDVVQYIPFRRTRSTGDRGSFFSSDEIARETYPLSERKVPSADRKRSTSSIRIPVDRIPQPASNRPPLSGRRNTRNQSISVTVRPEWDEDRTVAFVESESTARCHPRKSVAQQVMIPLTQDCFTETDNENDQIMYVPVRRSTARQLRFWSVPVAPPSRRSSMERRSVRPYASEMTSVVRCPTASRRYYGGSVASLGEDSALLIHAAVGGPTRSYIDDEDCSFDHRPMRQREAGRRFGYNPDTLPSCRLSAVAPGGSKKVGGVSRPSGARQRTSLSRRSTGIAATKGRPSTNSVVLERRPRPVSRDEVGDSEKYEPVDVSVGSTTSSTAMYEAGHEPSYSSSRQFVSELDYDEMPIPFVYVPVSDSSLCDTNTGWRTQLRPSPGTGGATGMKYASERVIAGQRSSDTRVRGAFFSARSPSASTPDDTDIEPGNGEPVDYSPGVNASGGSFGVSLQKRPSSTTLTGVAALSMADNPLVVVEGSNVMGRRVHPNRVASRLTAQLEPVMLTGRSEALDERLALQVPRRSVHTQVSDEHEDDIVLVPVRRSVARCEDKKQAKFQAVDLNQDKEEDSWEHQNQKVPTVQEGFAPVPQCISSAPAVTPAASRKPSGSANTRRKSSVPAVPNEASIIIGSGAVLRQGCYEADQEWPDTGVVAKLSQPKGDAETATVHPRGAFRKSSCGRARSVVPLATQTKKNVELFDDGKHLTSDIRSLSKNAPGRTLRAPKRPGLPRQNASSRYSNRQSSQPVAAGQNDGDQHRSSERGVREGRGVRLSAAPVGEPPRSHRRQMQRGDELSDDNAHFDHGESSVEKRQCQTRLGGRSSTRLQGSAAAVRAATGRSLVAVEDTEESEAPDVEAGVEREEHAEEESAFASCHSVRHSNKGRGRVTVGVSPATDQYLRRSSQVYGCRKTMRLGADAKGDEYEESRRKAASWTATVRDSFGGKRSVQENLFPVSDQEEECDVEEEGNQTPDNADDFAGGEIASTYDSSDSMHAALEDENGTILVPLRRSTRRQTRSSTPRRMSTRVGESESNPSKGENSSLCCRCFMCCCGPEVPADTPGDSPDRSLATPPQPKYAREKQAKDSLRISITQKCCGQNAVTGEAARNVVTCTRKATLQLPLITAPRNVRMNRTSATQRPRHTVERGSLQPNAVNLRTSVTDRPSSPTEEQHAYEDDDGIEGNGGIVDDVEETSVDACAMQPLTTPPAAESPVPVPLTRCAATSPIPPTEELTSRMLSSTSMADQQPNCNSLTRSSQLSTSGPQVTVQLRGTVPPTPPRPACSVVTQGCSSALPRASSTCCPVGSLNISEHIVAHSSAAKSLNTGRDMDGTPQTNQQTRSIPGNCQFGGEATHRPSQYCYSPPRSATAAQWKPATVSEAPFSVPEALDSGVTCDAAGKHHHTSIEKELEIQKEGGCVRMGAPLLLSAEAVPNKARDATDFSGEPPLRASTGPSLVERELREGHTSSSLLSREVEGFNHVSLAIPANPIPTTQKGEGEEMRSWFCSATIGRAACPYTPQSHQSFLYSRLPRTFRVFRSSGSLSHRSTALSGAGTAPKQSTSCGIESRFYLSRGQGDRLSSCHQLANVFAHACASRTLSSGKTWDSFGLSQREEDSSRNSGSECDAPKGGTITHGGSSTHADGRVQHARLQSAQKWKSCNSGHTSAEAAAAQAAAASFYASSLAKGGFRGKACIFPCSPSPPSSDGGSGTATVADAWYREGHTENCPYCIPPCGKESVERNHRKTEYGCDEGRTDSSAAATSNRRVIGVSGAATQTKESTGSVDERGKTECQWEAWWNPRKRCGTARILATCTCSISPSTRCLGETRSRVQRPHSPVSRTASMVFSLGRKSDTSLTRGTRFLRDAPKCVPKSGERFSTSSGQSGTCSALASHWSLDTREPLCTSLSALSIPSLPNSFCIR